MVNKVLAVTALIMMLATSCSGSAQLEVAGVGDPATPSSNAATVDRATVPAIEPPAEPDVGEPVGDPQDGPAPASGPESIADDPAVDNEGADESDPPASSDAIVISPEAPLPAERLCTVDVDETEELNLRDGPSLDARIVFGIPGGSCRMRVIGAASNGWVQVIYETQNISVIGYVSTDFAEEDPVRTLHLTWFERVVAEQDTTDLVGQDIALDGFPAAAYRVVPFDVGNPIDCQPMDFGVTGCPVHVLDSAGKLVTSMTIQTQFVPVEGGVSEVKVTSFNECFGELSCDPVDFSLHNRIVVDDTTTLAGVAIGADAEEAIEALALVFGTPTLDTGWIIGCPLDSETERNERYVDWGSLSTGFRQFDLDREGPYFHDWSYDLDQDRTADPAGPQPWEVRLPEGSAIGMNISVAAENLGVELFENGVLQRQQVRSDAWAIHGQGIETDTRIVAVGVPFIPLCD